MHPPLVDGQQLLRLLTIAFNKQIGPDLKEHKHPLIETTSGYKIEGKSSTQKKQAAKTSPAKKPAAKQTSTKSETPAKSETAGEEQETGPGFEPKEDAEKAKTPMKRPAAAMKRPAASMNESASSRKVVKYEYHKENKWGVKCNGSEWLTVGAFTHWTIRTLFCFDSFGKECDNNIPVHRHTHTHTYTL